ncbi:two-component regulator propeller domain-containing protein [Sphingomonas sp. MMS12-HWE2-04]|uniref:sensor histidine kinase n=1 Tax=Sphingomonas sp. MMS12-HWE2-04 TaxID=3234199 RepID=UPI00384C5C3D
MRLLRLIAGLLPLCIAQPAAANALGSDGFTHSGWTSKDGIPGMLQALAQTPDGYLWLGTYEGLYRFDGVSFEHVPPAPGHPAGAIPVSAVFVARNGDLWVGYAGGAGAEIYRHGALVRAGMPNAPGEITEFREDADGAIWAVGGRTRRMLKRYSHGQWQAIDARWGVPDDEPVSSLFAARDGTLWLAAKTRLLYLRRGATRFEDSGRRIRDGASMAQDAAGDLWISDPSGTWMLPDYPRGQRTAHNTVFYPAAPTVRRTMILFDRAGNLWGSTYTGGVFRIPQPGRSAPDAVVRYASSDGLTSNQAVAMLRDREGNIWAATEVGLDQFRRANVVQVPLPPKTTATGYLIAADQRGNVYIASGATLYRVPPGGDPVPILAGLDEPRALCRGRGDALWLVELGSVLRLEQGRITARLPLPDAGPTTGCGEDGAGRLWLARLDLGVLRRDGDRWQRIALPAAAGRAQDVTIDAAGNPVLVLDRRALMRIEGSEGRLWSNAAIGVAGLTLVRGMPEGLYVAGGTGLARWNGKGFARLSIADHPWLRGIRGMVHTPRGETWMINNKGILRVTTADLDRAFADPHRPLAHDLFGEQDGLTSRTQGSDGAQMAMGGDGRLWFLTRQGVVRIDPAALVRNPTPPPVRIRALTADGVRHADPVTLTLAAGTRSLAIDYTALSLSVPSRVRFRYQLEGVDPDWTDPGTRRQAFYTNLAPGTYRFRVIAANDAGVWNRTGATLEFTVPPTFLQSRLFVLLCLAAAGLVLWLLYGLRLRAVARRMRARMAARIAERERIARELHDTLLQGVQALVLRFQLVADDIAPDQPARRALEEALDRADQVLVEGRDRVRNLRASGDDGQDLAEMLLDVVRRQAFAPTTAIQVVTTGAARPLNALVRDEVTRIANEALFNIWRHARAGRVEIEIVYRAASFGVRFRDDGVGIPADILKAGRREGHFGLTGMRERADKIEAELTIRSGPAAGSEVALLVPAAIAYARSTRRRRARRTAMGDELA